MTTDARVMELAMEKYRSRYGTTKIYHPENYCQGFKNGYESGYADGKEAAMAEMKRDPKSHGICNCGHRLCSICG